MASSIVERPISLSAPASCSPSPHGTSALPARTITFERILKYFDELEPRSEVRVKKNFVRLDIFLKYFH
jgi:hypothetical protein